MLEEIILKCFRNYEEMFANKISMMRIVERLDFLALCKIVTNFHVQ